MKRYNIHFPEHWMPEIKKIKEALIKTNQSAWFWRSVSTADLIRIAVAARFNLKDPEVHVNINMLNNAINRVVKFKPRKGRLHK